MCGTFRLLLRRKAMNNYRVDRAMEALSPPCGMNSILYSGDSYTTAMHIFNCMEGGKTAWGEPHRDYGIMLSIWNPDRGDWIVKRWKSK